MFSGAAACALEPSVLSFAPRAPALPAASFARDRGRILRSRAFRRLAGKTQVVAAPGDPLVRTRLTHTLEVVAIARELGSGLQVRDDLVEAIALAHDVGHPAFGHAGERALASLGGSSFHHAAHGVRVVTVLEPGLDLSVEVVEGILKHSKGRGGPVFAGGPAQRSATVEARVVRAADLYAYACHDLDDAYRLGALRPADLPIEARRVLGATAESVRASLVDRTLAASGSGGDVRLDDPSAAALEVLRAFLYESLYESPRITAQTTFVGAVVACLAGAASADPESFDRAVGDVTGGALPHAASRAFLDTFASLTDRQALELHRRFRARGPRA